MPSFSVNDRVRHIESGREGRVSAVHDFVDITMDDGEAIHCQPDGSTCCCNGAFEPIDASPEFTVGQRVRYLYARARPIGTVTEVTDSFVRVLLDDQPNYEGGYHTRSFDLQGRGGRTDQHDDATADGKLVIINPNPETDFKVGQRVTYAMTSGAMAQGVVHSIDDQFVYMTIDETETHVRYVGYRRIFNLDGTGTGSVSGGIPFDVRSTELGSQLVAAPKEWEPTPGREYPEKPRLAYGVFDGYYGRPLQQGDPTGNGATVGWGVINWDEDGRRGFRQTVSLTEQAAVSAGYIATASAMWLNECLEIDLAAIENPLQLLKGLEVYCGWASADAFGMEIYFPRELTARIKRRIDFQYPLALASYGLVSMDTLNQFFRDNAGAMRVVDVDGTKITIAGSTTIEFHVVPRLIEDFRPTLIAGDANTKLLLLHNLALQSEARDSTQGDALAIAA